MFSNKQFQYLFTFSLLLTCTILVYFHLNDYKAEIVNTINNSTANTKKTKTSNIKSCYNEWFLLNEDVYFRRNLAFYYKDTKKIRLFYDRRKNDKNLNIEIFIKIKLKDSVFTNLHTLKSITYTTIHQHNSYSFESLKTEFDINGLQSFDDIHLFQVFVLNGTSKSQDPLDLIIKNYYQSDELKNHSIVCSKLYYFNKDYAKDFEWWIEMNKIHGYDKLVIYNNSIENSYDFNKLFEDYKGFVELKQFKCIPNFIEQNNTLLPFITTFEEIETKLKTNFFEYHVHFEQFVFNECYLQNKDKYKYVTINDQDESIVPRYLTNFKREEQEFITDNKNFVIKSESHCFYPSNKDSTKKNIEIYMDNLKLNNSLKDRNVTFHFNMGVYLKHKTMDTVFTELGRFFNQKNDSNMTMNKIRITDPSNNNFKITINTQKEYLYAEYLYSLYTKIIKPFYDTNEKSLNQISESYNRLFYLLGPSTTWFCGKTIHNTLLTNTLSTHYPEPFIAEFIPIENGHSSHFRREYNINWEDKSITEFNFDLNYFLCYFKPILKRLNIDIIY